MQFEDDDNIPPEYRERTVRKINADKRMVIKEFIDLDEGINLKVYELSLCGKTPDEISEIINQDNKSVARHGYIPYTSKDIRKILKEIKQCFMKKDVLDIEYFRKSMLGDLFAMKSVGWKRGDMKTVGKSIEQIRAVLNLDIKKTGIIDESDARLRGIPFSVSDLTRELVKEINATRERENFVVIEGESEKVDASPETEGGVL